MCFFVEVMNILNPVVNLNALGCFIVHLHTVYHGSMFVMAVTTVPNLRMKSISKLLHAVENRVYHNEAAARRARSMMNSMGTLLQEMISLLDVVDEEKDGYSYVLYDLGKQESSVLKESAILTNAMEKPGGGRLIMAKQLTILSERGRGLITKKGVGLFIRIIQVCPIKFGFMDLCLQTWVLKPARDEKPKTQNRRLIEARDRRGKYPSNEEQRQFVHIFTPKYLIIIVLLYSCLEQMNYNQRSLLWRGIILCFVESGPRSRRLFTCPCTIVMKYNKNALLIGLLG